MLRFCTSHSVAYDGHKYWAMEDTEHGRIVFYTFSNGKFHQVADLNNLGTRTHRLRYDQHSNSFMLISATSGDFWRIQITNNKPKIIQHVDLKKYLKPQGKDFEIRTFTRHNGMLYFVSSLATPEILIVKDDKNLTMVKKYLYQPIYQICKKFISFLTGRFLSLVIIKRLYC